MIVFAFALRLLAFLLFVYASTNGRRAAAIPLGLAFWVLAELAETVRVL
jgi:hypothetical protein